VGVGTVNTYRRCQLTELTEAEIVKAMGPFSYGKGTDRTIGLLVYTLAHGLLEINAGFRTGGTLTMILRDMGMISGRSGNITKKGRAFLFDCFTVSVPTYRPSPLKVAGVEDASGVKTV